MKKNCTTIKHFCNGEQYATCVAYEGSLPEFSELGDCVSIEETTEELYDLIGVIKEEIDLTTLEGDCLTLPPNLTVQTFAQFLITTICTMQTTISEMQETIATQAEQILELQENPCP